MIEPEQQKEILSVIAGKLSKMEISMVMKKIEDIRLTKGLFVYLMANKDKVNLTDEDLFSITLEAGLSNDFLDTLDDFNEDYEYFMEELTNVAKGNLSYLSLIQKMIAAIENQYGEDNDELNPQNLNYKQHKVVFDQLHFPTDLDALECAKGYCIEKEYYEYAKYLKEEKIDKLEG